MIALLVLMALVNPAVQPEARPDPWWHARHEAVLQEEKAHRVDLVFVGDSITQNWDTPGYRAVWDRFYGKRNALNLGFSGDTTSNVLWRFQHGELDGIHPRVAVVLIGTNNTGVYHNQGAMDTAGGIVEVVSDLHARLPRTRVLLLGILPSTISAHKTADDAAVNHYLERYYRYSGYVTFLDIGNVFMKDGQVNTMLFADPLLDPHLPALHPSEVGQTLMALAIEPTLKRLLKEKD